MDQFNESLEGFGVSENRENVFEVDSIFRKIWKTFDVFFHNCKVGFHSDDDDNDDDDLQFLTKK